MRSLLLLYVMISLVGCSDIVTESYDTLEDARISGLFERGWLPDILPETSHSITVSNDLDLNSSEGEFHFDPDVATSFFFNTKMVHDDRCKTNIGNAPVKKGDCITLQHTTEEYRWRFYCLKNGGYCYYIMTPLIE